MQDRHIGNVGIGAFVASYWQGGILGIVLYVFGVAGVIVFSIGAGRANNLMAHLLFFWLASLPTMHIMFGTADQIWMRLIQIAAVHFVFLSPQIVGIGRVKSRRKQYRVVGMALPEQKGVGLPGSF